MVEPVKNLFGAIFFVSVGMLVDPQILVDYALTLADRGLSAEEMEWKLLQKRESVKLLAMVDTLEYLKKGGRISAAVALAGSLLSIKPVAAIEDGSIVMAGKARGSKQGNNLLRQLVEKSGGINFEKPFCLAYSGLSDALLRKYVEDSSELWAGKTERLPIATVGCTIGTHAGPGAIALAFFENQ